MEATNRSKAQQLYAETSLAERNERQAAVDRNSCSRLTSRRSPVRAGHRPSLGVRFRTGVPPSPQADRRRRPCEPRACGSGRHQSGRQKRPRKKPPAITAAGRAARRSARAASNTHKGNRATSPTAQRGQELQLAVPGARGVSQRTADVARRRRSGARWCDITSGPEPMPCMSGTSAASTSASSS